MIVRPLVFNVAPGGIARWSQLQPSSAWLLRRKCSKMFSLCTTRITHTILLECTWILDFHFKIVVLLRRRYLIPIRCNNGQRKRWPWRWLHHFDFSTGDGFRRWWRWLHQFRQVIFDTRTHDPLQMNMHIGCMIVVRCDTCKIFGAYAQLDCKTTSIVGNVGSRHSMQVTHSKKRRIFKLFHPQLKTNLWIIWHHKLKLLLNAKYD